MDCDTATDVASALNHWLAKQSALYKASSAHTQTMSALADLYCDELKIPDSGRAEEDLILRHILDKL